MTPHLIIDLEQTKDRVNFVVLRRDGIGALSVVDKGSAITVEAACNIVGRKAGRELGKGRGEKS